MPAPAIVIELEAGPQYGMGHFGRCLVIAKALAAAGADPRFRIVGALNAEASLAGFAEAPPDAQADILLLDRYHASADHIAELRHRHRVLVAIDDHATRPLPADLVINGNYYGAALDYSAYGTARVLAGPDYAPVAPVFRAESGTIPKCGSILMTFGLSDVAGTLAHLAPDVARAFPDRQVTAIIPARFPVSNQPGNLTLLAPQPLAPLVGRHETIICGLGVTWQEAATARRRVIGIRLVDNQDLMLDAVSREGFPALAGPDTEALITLVEAPDRADWRAVHARLDGAGPARIAAAILDAAA